ncbi:hypothetical protein [Bdellovibrio sp. KM01]|uniref:hypothetical protein n=1 Tax=Bdellovibrio sp. KM01 TaxID=2748865 RepID=UPI0015EA0190|nr:hypothetical protein [Bdellovibrio sp. KM01]QLY26400.1 hypothetical protein HW988_05070 [Bdellovibrio sp. KM01]
MRKYTSKSRKMLPIRHSITLGLIAISLAACSHRGLSLGMYKREEIVRSNYLIDNTSTYELGFASDEFSGLLAGTVPIYLKSGISLLQRNFSYHDQEYNTGSGNVSAQLIKGTVGMDLMFSRRFFFSALVAGEALIHQSDNNMLGYDQSELLLGSEVGVKLQESTYLSFYVGSNWEDLFSQTRVPIEVGLLFKYFFVDVEHRNKL